MIKIPVIIDTDPGVDDLTAILLANSCEKFDIRAITAVSGNVPYECVCKNALDIADCLHLDCRVAKGAEKPLICAPHYAFEIHGQSGLGSIQLPAAKRNFDPDRAWDVIYDEAVKAAGELVIFAIGPLTNIALAFLKYPDLPKYIKHIYSMGGSGTVGNMTPYAEFNYMVDPHAAQIVFASGMDITMVGLDACYQAPCDDGFFEALSSSASSIAPLLKELSGDYTRLKSYFGPTYKYTLYDAITVAVAIDESMMTAERHNISIELKSDLTFGQSVVDYFNKDCADKPQSNVVISIDSAKYAAVMADMAKYYECH